MLSSVAVVVHWPFDLLDVDWQLHQPAASTHLYIVAALWPIIILLPEVQPLQILTLHLRLQNVSKTRIWSWVQWAEPFPEVKASFVTFLKKRLCTHWLKFFSRSWKWREMSIILILIQNWHLRERNWHQLLARCVLRHSETAGEPL